MVCEYRNVKRIRLTTIWFILCVICVMPNLGELIFTLPVATRQEIRKLEKVCLKLNKTELACAFNECCLRENILPKYSICERPNPTVYGPQETPNNQRPLPKWTYPAWFTCKIWLCDGITRSIWRSWHPFYTSMYSDTTRVKISVKCTGLDYYTHN